MAYAMTKRGSQDNIVTYEFICDNISDLEAIENKYKTIGTIAIVLIGESEGLEVYICGSDQQWSNLGTIGTDTASNNTTGLSIYICTQNEYNSITKVPTISNPDENTLYLVPASSTSGNLYDEYIYANNNWEKFGAGNIDLSNYATLEDIYHKTGIANVADYGAIGDGITDDSAAIQAAVDAAYDIYFESNKTYYIPTAITINHDVHLYGGKNTILKTETHNGSLNNIFNVIGTLKKTTTLTTDYISAGKTDNSGNKFTLTDMTGIAAGDIMIIKATDQYYSYARSYYYLGMSLLIGDKDNSHIYTTNSIPYDIELTENVTASIYSAPTAIIENLKFVGDRQSIGQYKYFIKMAYCRNSIIRNCEFSEMDNGIIIDHCVNTLIDNIIMYDGKNDNTISGDGYGIEILSATNTTIQRMSAIVAQTPITTGGDITTINLYVHNCELASQCRHHGIGMHENAYNTIIEDCTLGGVNFLGTGIINRCRFIQNNRLDPSSNGGITFCGSHNPNYAILKIKDCTFEGFTNIYVYSPTPQNPIQSFDCIVGLIDIQDCTGGSIIFEGTISTTILSNTIKQLNMQNWKDCKEVYLPDATDLIEKMIVSNCTFTHAQWINDHKTNAMFDNVLEIDYSSIFPIQHKITVNKDTIGERYTLPENVSINLSSTNSTTSKYIICGNNLASNNPDDYCVGIVSGADNDTLTRTVSTANNAPIISNDTNGNIVYTQQNSTGAFNFYPIGMFYVKDPGTVSMSAKIKSTSAVQFRPYIAIVNCDTGKLVSRYTGSIVEATSSGATISYSHAVTGNQVVLCYYYNNVAIANAVTTFEDMQILINNDFAPWTSNTIQPFQARRRTGDGAILSLDGVNNIMCSDQNFHVKFSVDYVENPINGLPNGAGVSF